MPLMRTIPLTQGKVALVNNADHAVLGKLRWYAVRTANKWYACRHNPGRKGKSNSTLFMHRVIMNPAKGLEVDHRDGDGLNNQRTNLRVCTHAENIRNSKMPTSNTSGKKGVWWSKRFKKWAASIKASDRNITLGYFSDKEAAYQAYCKAAKEHHGEFARL